jgi:hypothetical protein
MGTISNLFEGIPGVKQDWKTDWTETSKSDWKFDWDSTVGEKPALPAPVNTVLPAISGDALVGETLTATLGTWSGIGNTYSRVWMRDGEEIDGETAATYEVVEADVGTEISVRVTASNNSGIVSASSATVFIEE